MSDSCEQKEKHLVEIIHHCISIIKIHNWNSTQDQTHIL